MNNKFLTVAILAFGIISLDALKLVLAEPERSPSVRTERTPALREFVFKRFSHVRELADEGKLDKAISELEELKQRGGMSPYETAMMWNLFAYLHYTRDDYPAALRAYNNVVKQDRIPQSLYTNTLYSMAQLHIAQEQYREALEPMKKWFAATPEPGAKPYVFLAQIQLQIGNLDEAAKNVTRGMEVAQAQGLTPAEQWLLLARAIYYQQKNFERLRDTLASLALSYPKRKYWVQLSAVFGELGDEKRQVAALEAAYEQDLFEKESDFVSLARLLMSNDVPYKAARILEKGIENEYVTRNADNLRLLGDAWMMARELDGAIRAYSDAAEMSDDGETWLRIAQIRIDNGEWNEAAAAATKALSQGGLKRDDVGHMIHGLARFNQGDFAAARKAFEAAARFEESEAAARQWLQYVDREQARKTQLEAMLEDDAGDAGAASRKQLVRDASKLGVGS